MNPPQVECEQIHPTLKVRDVQAAVDFYTNKLGFKTAFTWSWPAGGKPTFAGVTLGQVRLFLAEGTPNREGGPVCFSIGNADELFEFQQSNGVEVDYPPADQVYGIRDYQVRDLDGNPLTFGHPAWNAGPAVKIERVDVPVRLEKRLAALLTDLAARKKMTINSCLEEILLHTCEPFEGGVASPHTLADLRYIQELKKKHGIDYDCHASYRFVEVTAEE